MTAETSLATEAPAAESAAVEVATDDPRALTIPNVERVLDELRPYLMADGGNVEIVEIDGPVVKVRLQGACGSCPQQHHDPEDGHRAQAARGHPRGERGDPGSLNPPSGGLSRDGDQPQWRSAAMAISRGPA